MKFERASLVLGTVYGVRFVLHWSVAIAFVVLIWFGARVETFVGLVIIVVVHEIGHAVFARITGASPEEVMVHGLGGVTHWAGDISPLRKSVVAWGGIAFQLLLFGLVSALADDMSTAMHTQAAQRSSLLDTLLFANFAIAMLNLIPIAPLDGALAWRIFPRGYRAVRKVLRLRKVRTLEEELAALKHAKKRDTNLDDLPN